MDIKAAIKQFFINKLNKAYEKELAGMKISYAAWVDRQEKQEALVAADASDFVVLLYEKGTLSAYAAPVISRYMAVNEDVELAYGDEDFMEAGVRVKPWYKPVWSPDLYEEFFYMGSVVVVRRSLLERAQVKLPKLLEKASLSLAVFEAVAELRETVDALLPYVNAFDRGCKGIGHVEAVLFHGETWENIQEFYEAGSFGKQKSVSDAELSEKVSVIIPSKDNPEILRVCLESLQRSTKHCDIEIIVVDNGSSPENKARYQALLEGHQYVYEPREFNFSAMCNLGASKASGRYLLFLNDDIELCDNRWLWAMKEKAALPYAGAVGLKLLYPDSDKIQHAGIVNLPVGPVHKCQFASDENSYYFGRNKFNHNCIGVTGACLMLDIRKFQEIGGFCEGLPVAYNDVELGFALYEKGYQNVVVNSHFAYHHESLSRGSDEVSREKVKRLVGEREKLYELHPSLRGEDPYYPRGLERESVDSRVVPLYHTAKNTVQMGMPEKINYKSEEIRVDKCVLCAADVSVPGRIRGYGVVLGDNNACYDRYLVLAPVGGDLSEVYQLKCANQYRQDLEQNLPDQRQVALCGFWVDYTRALLPPGVYEIGVMAVHKLNKGRLLNYTERSIVVEE